MNDPALRTYDPVRASPLTFEEIDHEAFPMFSLGCDAGRKGGGAPAAFNAANEVAVGAFLRGRVRFREIADIVGEAVARAGNAAVRDVRDVLEADQRARAVASETTERMLRARNRSVS